MTAICAVAAHLVMFAVCVRIISKSGPLAVSSLITFAISAMLAMLALLAIAVFRLVGW